jgi:DNA-binding response OmpR family regulator
MDRRASILIVDDDEANRYTTRLMLERAGFGVREAETGRGGLELADEGPDLVMLDLHLPDISGLEICRQLKASARTSFIPVLHVTAMYPGSEERAEALAAGADGYLTRPLDAEQLLATITTVLARRAA